MRIDVVSIFPEYLSALDLSLIGKARQDGVLDVCVHDLRTFTTDRHRTVDDTPYGGGAGMVLRVDVVDAALNGVYGADRPRIAVLTPGPNAAMNTSSSPGTPHGGSASTTSCPSDSSRAAASTRHATCCSPSVGRRVSTRPARSICCR